MKTAAFILGLSFAGGCCILAQAIQFLAECVKASKNATNHVFLNVKDGE